MRLGDIYGLVPCLSFPLPGCKLSASWAGLWVGQRAAPQVYQAEPPQQRRVETSLQKLIVSSQVHYAPSWGGAATSL